MTVSQFDESVMAFAPPSGHHERRSGTAKRAAAFTRTTACFQGMELMTTHRRCRGEGKRSGRRLSRWDLFPEHAPE